jgi:hypothetical protein
MISSILKEATEKKLKDVDINEITKDLEDIKSIKLDLDLLITDSIIETTKDTIFSVLK